MRDWGKNLPVLVLGLALLSELCGLFRILVRIVWILWLSSQRPSGTSTCQMMGCFACRSAYILDVNSANKFSTLQENDPKDRCFGRFSHFFPCCLRIILNTIHHIHDTFEDKAVA